eukprot:618898-Prymnesium_polylepis.1
MHGREGSTPKGHWAGGASSFGYACASQGAARLPSGVPCGVRARGATGTIHSGQVLAHLGGHCGVLGLRVAARPRTTAEQNRHALHRALHAVSVH